MKLNACIQIEMKLNACIQIECGSLTVRNANNWLMENGIPGTQLNVVTKVVH